MKKRNTFTNASRSARRPAERADKPKARRKDSPGASHSRTGIRDRWQSYLHNHGNVARDSLRRLLQRPATTLLTCMVIGIALAMPSGLYIALDNISRLSSGWDGAARISVFLKHSQSEEQGRKLAASLQAREDVASTHFISAERALDEFRAMSGFGEIIDHLGRNPLPAVIVVTPAEKDMSAEKTRALHEQLSALAEVDQAKLDLEWVARLYSLMQLGNRITIALALLLALGVLLVIGNTIKLSVESRRDEILVVKLVGGTNSFVRRPFLYTGFWYGLGGGILAWLLVQFSLLWLRGPIRNLADLYESDYLLSGLGFINSIGLWLLGALLGLLGAWLVVGRELRAIEPT